MTSTSEISRLRIITASSAAETSRAPFRLPPLMGEGEGGGDTSYRRDRLSWRESRERSSCKRVRSHSAGFWNSDIMADHDSVDYETLRGETRFLQRLQRRSKLRPHFGGSLRVF